MKTFPYDTHTYLFVVDKHQAAQCDNIDLQYYMERYWIGNDVDRNGSSFGVH